MANIFSDSVNDKNLTVHIIYETEMFFVVSRDEYTDRGIHDIRHEKSFLKGLYRWTATKPSAELRGSHLKFDVSWILLLLHSLDRFDGDLAVRNVIGHGVLVNVQCSQPQGNVVLEFRSVAFLNHVVTALRNGWRKSKTK